MNTLTQPRRALRASIAAAAALGLAAALSACGPSTQAPQGSGTASPAQGGTSASPGAGSHDGSGLSLTDPWIKATDKGNGMTAMFGALKNNTDKDRTVVSASSDVAGMVQLHETVPAAAGGTQMREKKGGFPLAAHSSMELAPGGEHVMLMGLKRQLQPGDEVTVMLTLDDGSTLVSEVGVRAFSGGKESYAPTDDAATGGSEHAGMDHGSMDHGSADRGSVAPDGHASAHPSGESSHEGN